MYFSIKQTPEIHKGRLMRSDGADNDLHICVLCVKAVMNTSVSFSLVFVTIILKYACSLR